MIGFAPGDFLPTFVADSSIGPGFDADVLSGHRHALVFLASAGSQLGRAVADALLGEADWLAQQRIRVYLVSADHRDRHEGRLETHAGRFGVFWDFDRAIHRLHGLDVSPPGGRPTLRTAVFLKRENRRLHAIVPATPLEDLGARMPSAVATLPDAEPARELQGNAPVLTIPDVLDRAFCRRLIEHFDADGGRSSGFMRDVGERTQGLVDGAIKRRRDLYLSDPELLQPLRHGLVNRVVPEIRKAFGFQVTRVERYLIGCYDASDRGFFKPHRDNTTKATAHRRFAMSLNLNAEEHEGGSLRFPEYGPHTYRPPTGGAVVFSCSLLHEALPVTRGRRLVVLPFLHDEHSAEIRAATQHHLDDGVPQENRH